LRVSLVGRSALVEAGQTAAARPIASISKLWPNASHSSGSIATTCSSMGGSPGGGSGCLGAVAGQLASQCRLARGAAVGQRELFGTTWRRGRWSAISCAGIRHTTDEAIMHMNPAETNRVSVAAACSAGGAGLQVHALTKRYGERLVRDNVNLGIVAGEFVAVVGRSGCGKSTLLRLVAGLEQPDAGQATVAGGGPAPEVRMIFQEAWLLPWKTVLANVALGLPRGAPGALEALSAVGLAQRAGEWPAVLSGGQRQRVALARALVHAPQLLLLDEPLGALDALTRIEMQQLIESLWLRRGFTAVLVTHDVQEALALADRVLVIEAGRISHDVRIDLPRPRVRGSAAFAALEQQVLAQVLGAKTPA
jgi:sulfonate transport system ATP-binding protein